MTDIREGASSQITFSLKQNDGSLIPKIAILTLTVKLYDVETHTAGSATGIINSRNDTSIKDVNGGTLNVDGTGTLDLTALDNVIVNNTLNIGEIETHAALISFTADGGVSGNDEIRFGVIRKA